MQKSLEMERKVRRSLCIPCPECLVEQKIRDLELKIFLLRDDVVRASAQLQDLRDHLDNLRYVTVLLEDEEERHQRKKCFEKQSFKK